MLINTKAFTIIELMFTVAIIGIIASLTIKSYSSSLSKGRDTERKTDISALYLGLEEFHYNNTGYPESFNTVVLGNLDSQALEDPKGGTIDIMPAVADEAAAGAVAAPSPYPDSEYQYIPIDCSAGVCKKYILRTYLENTNVGGPYLQRNSVN